MYNINIEKHFLEKYKYAVNRIINIINEELNPGESDDESDE